MLAALKGDGATASIPVVMLTMLDDRSLGYALGATDYLTKPIDRERLVAALAPYRRELPVLVVDDDPDLRALLRCMLEREGYVVAEADNGRAALERVRERTPGAILLDLMTPEMDGFEFLEELRRDEAGCGIPVIVITARDLSAEDHQVRWSASSRGRVWPRCSAGRGAPPGGSFGGTATRSLSGASRGRSGLIK